MFNNWLIFIFVGRVLIYLWQQFPLPKPLEKFGTIQKLHVCDLCAGVWIYGVLSFFMGMSLLEVLGFQYFPIVSEVVTGGIISFIVHIFLIGWKEKFYSMWVI